MEFRFRRAALGFAVAVTAMLPVHASPLGLVFNNNFNLSGDGSSLNANLSAGEVTQWENAIDYIESVYSSAFSDSITINLTIDAAPGTSALGESETQLTGAYTYAQIKTALTNDASSAADDTAVANLPASDPTNGADFLLATAQAKALGLMNPNSTISDGTVTFGAGWNYTFDPNNRAVPGDFDFIGVAEHEITEVMGRIGLLGENLDGSPDYSILDLFGYTSPGHISLAPQVNGAYFSIDGGVTNLKTFNDAINGGDAKDWASGTNDSFNAFTGSGTLNALSAVDLETMDVIGYNTVTPEPGYMVPLCVAGIAFFFLRRRTRELDR
jgi:hypothetical protein